MDGLNGGSIGTTEHIFLRLHTPRCASIQGLACCKWTFTGSSITRNFYYLKPVINFVLSDYALDVRTPFIGVYLDRSPGVLVRKPVPITDTRNVQSECRAIDDDMRCLIALISNTGRRRVQGAGLLKRDFMGLDTDLPFVRVTKHPWRNLKTASSECKVPLIDETLWAVRRMVEADNRLDFAFPRYNKDQLQQPIQRVQH